MPKRKREPEVEPCLETTYAPLSEAVDSSFRICTLLPGDSDRAILCRLSEDDWELATTSYEAISYAWGDHWPTKTIHLNGRPFQVGSNLESLLRHLRQRGRGKPREKRLWVDAICIDQANNFERSHQVQKMYQIYNRATQVIVWLGDAHSDSDLAFEFMNKHVRPSLEAVGYSCTDEQTNAAKSSFWDQWDEGKDAETLEVIEHLMVKKYAKSWSAVARLLKRPWWNRAWTVQELISAHSVSVHCGNSSVPWPLLEMMIQLMLRNTEIENLYPKRDQIIFHEAIEDAHAFAYEHYHRVLGGHGPESFPQLMQVTRCRQSEDPRDKVFSILSLLDTVSTKYHYEPNYFEPVHRAYTRVAQAQIQSSKNLHILSSCCYLEENSGRASGAVRLRENGQEKTKAEQGTRAESATEEVLPSWVPNWEGPVNTSYLGGYSARDKEFCYAASLSSVADVEFSPDSNVMSVSGIMVDIIKDSQLQGSDSDFDYLFTAAKEEPWTSWDIHRIAAKLEEEPAVVRQDSETIIQAVMKTLIADRHPATGKRRHELWLRRIRQHLWPKAEDLEGYLSHVQMFTQGRTLVLSKDGYVGLAPSSTAIGDKICVLYGCHAPVILRPSKTNVSMYTLIGDAYIHGLMDGEALRLTEAILEKRDVFNIG